MNMFQGSMVALVTPMHSDGRIDWDGLSRLIDFHCEKGTDAIVVVGTTGESPTVGFEEHVEVIEFAVRAVDGRLPLIGGTGQNATSESIYLTKRAKEVGADACLLVTPYYNKPTQEGLFQHHKAVAEAVDIPQILYNVPGRTAVDMQPETVQRLAQIDNIIGIKDATADIGRVRRILDNSPEDFFMVSGDDASSLDFMLAGGKGVISVTANVAPEAMRALCRAAVAGDAERAAEINRPLEALHRDLFVEANPIPVKWALHEMGLIDNGIRLPLTWLSQPYHERVREALRQAGLL